MISDVVALKAESMARKEGGVGGEVLVRETKATLTGGASNSGTSGDVSH
jgi:hypothetical protein